MARRTHLILLALVLLAPLVSASWGSKGSSEPSTPWDWQDGLMFFDPARAPNLVYFNGFLTQEAGYFVSLGTTVNPNVAAVGTGFHPAPYRARALLGVWFDCNDDGYIGLGETGLMEYPDEFLPASHACPTGSPSPHLDGGIVREFFPLGWPGLGGRDDDPYQLVDRGARVWADEGTPTDAPRGYCFVLAHPRGTFSTLGGLLRAVDCYRQTTRGVDVLVEGGEADDDWEALKTTPHPWGSWQDPGAVDVWSCESRLVETPAGTIMQPHLVPRVDASSSIGGTAYWATRGLDGCRAPHDASPATIADLPYLLEDDIAPWSGVRTSSDFVLRYVPVTRALSLLRDSSWLEQESARLTSPQGFWADEQVVAASSNPLVNRETLAVEGDRAFTFYAMVSTFAISDHQLRVPGTIAMYGTYACGAGIGPDQDPRRGWACDPDAWYVDTAMPMDPRAGWHDYASFEIGARVGDSYNIRDVDCLDSGTAPSRAEGLTAGGLTGIRCTTSSYQPYS